jgi:uncharacterized protein
MTIIADSSPLIILSKLTYFDLLNMLFPRIYVSTEVYLEVVVAGSGLPGAAEIAGAEWVEVRDLLDQEGLRTAQERHPLGVGELSTILLAKEIDADTVLLDDYRARNLAKAEGLRVRESVGLLETVHLRGHSTDLRAAFTQLLAHSYIEKQLLDLRLRSLGLPPL